LLTPRRNEVLGTYAPSGNGPDAPTETELPGQIPNATPANGAQNINIAVNLTWTAGARADSHDVYLGLVEVDVSSASNTTVGIFRGNQTSTLFDPGGLAPNTTFYWRIDEVNSVGRLKLCHFPPAEAPEKSETPGQRLGKRQRRSGTQLDGRRPVHHPRCLFWNELRGRGQCDD
jgi:hypothetical protein